MNRSILICLLLVCFIGALFGAYEDKIYSTTTIKDDFAGDRVLVVLDKSISDFNKVQSNKLFGSFPKTAIEDISQITSTAAITAFVDTYGVGEFRQVFMITLPQDDKKNVLAVIKELEKIKGILYAGPDHVLKLARVPNDPRYQSGELWGLNGTNGIKAPLAWNTTIGSDNTGIQTQKMLLLK